MAYSAKVGSFNIDTAKTVGQTQSITGVGFQPKIVLFWWSGSTATGDEVAGGSINLGFGAATSNSSRFCNHSISVDASATSSVRSYNHTDRVISLLLSAALADYDGSFDFGTMDENGFSLTVDDQFSNAYRISYLALGGDDLTNVYIGNKLRPSSAGEYDITDVGFRPDAVILSFNRLNLDTNNPTLFFSFGMATASSNQGVIGAYGQGSQADTNTNGYGYNGEVNAMPYGGALVYYQDSFVSFIDNGFRLNFIETNAFYFHYIAIKGGQYSVGDITTKTDGTDIAETVGFQPAALLFASANRALSTQDTATDHARLSIGAATSTSNRAVQAVSDEDNLADSETAHANYDQYVYAHVKDDALEAAMDLKSIDANGFTCVMDDVETAGCWVTYLAIGAAASGDLTVSKTESITVSDTPTVQKEGEVPDLSVAITPDSVWATGVRIYP